MCSKVCSKERELPVEVVLKFEAEVKLKKLEADVQLNINRLRPIRS